MRAHVDRAAPTKGSRTFRADFGGFSPRPKNYLGFSADLLTARRLSVWVSGKSTPVFSRQTGREFPPQLAKPPNPVEDAEFRPDRSFGRLQAHYSNRWRLIDEIPVPPLGAPIDASAVSRNPTLPSLTSGPVFRLSLRAGSVLIAPTATSIEPLPG